MKIPKPFKYSKYRMPQYTGKAPKSEPMRETEVLTGEIEGEAASDLEERFYTAAKNNPHVEYIEYQASFISRKNMPGEIRPDFIVYSGGMIYPIDVDGEFVHQQQQAEDDLKDTILNEALSTEGAYPIQHISGEFLQSQEDANAQVRKIFG